MILFYLCITYSFCYFLLYFSEQINIQCSLDFSTINTTSKLLVQVKKKIDDLKMNQVKFEKRKNLFRKNIFIYSIKNIVCKDLPDFFDEAFPLFSEQTEMLIEEHNVIKNNFCLIAKFKKKSDENSANEKKGNEENIENENVGISENRENISEDQEIKKHISDNNHDSQDDSDSQDDGDSQDGSDSQDDGESQDGSDSQDENPNEVLIQNVDLNDSNDGIIDPSNNSVLNQNKCLTENESDEFEESQSAYEYRDFYIRTNTIVIDHGTNLETEYAKNVSIIITKIDDLQEHGSGWTLDEIIRLDVHNYKFNCFGGSCFIPLPKEIQSKKAIINIQNKDNQCFKWSILASLHDLRPHPERVSKYFAFEEELEFGDLTFPIKLKDIVKFEKLNPNISVNVYGLNDIFNEKKKKMIANVVPLRLTMQPKPKHVHLLLLQNIEQKKNDEMTMEENIHNAKINSHYCLITDLAKLVGSQKTKFEHKIYICDACLNHFISEFNLNKHRNQCLQINQTRITMPTKINKYLSFKNYERRLVVPFVIYADIESILSTVEEERELQSFQCEKMPKGVYQLHIPNSIGLYFHNRIQTNKSFYQAFTGKDCIRQFTKKLFELSHFITETIRFIHPIILSETDKQNFHSAKNCHICDAPFTTDDKRVQDHCHLTGNYRGAAHNSCNLRYQVTRTIPIVFHNLGYDSHFLINEISSSFDGKVSVIPINNEHYISFTKTVDDSTEDYEKIKFRFIDSFRFMASSLQKLASYLPSDEKKITKREWKSLTVDQVKLLERKGIYPYDYIDSIEKLNETQLPPKEFFYNKLTDSNISDEEYSFAQNVWKSLNIKSLKEYTEIYLKTDVLLLADVFENFRDSCLKIYKLDPAHYFTAPGFSWDAMLKYTEIRIELISNIDQFLFVEKGKY